MAGFPRAFDDPRYRKQERDYKWKAHRRVSADLLSIHGRRVVAEGPPSALVDTLRTAVLKLIDEGGERAFAGLVEATGSLPADPGRARVLTWPIVTILPFLAKPNGHMFLKPMQTQRIAEAFTFDLSYSAYPKWGTYARLLTLSNRLLERLRPLGARDLIDVQSFMWVVAGWPFMKQVQR